MKRLTEWDEKERKFDRVSIKTTNQQLINKLAVYEGLEESGKLQIFPCTVGDTIWVIGVIGIDKAEPYKVTCITYRKDKTENDGVYVYASGRGQISFFVNKEWDRTVFHTREAAEAKLKEMEGKE